MNEHQHNLVAQGLARWHNGRLIPIVRGGSDEEPVFAPVPRNEDGAFDFSDVTDDALAALIADYEETRDEIFAGVSEAAANHGLTVDELFDVTREAVEVTLPALKTEQAARAVASVEVSAADEARFAELARVEAEVEAVVEPPEPAAAEAVEVEATVEAVTAAAGVAVTRGRMPRPTEGRQPVEHEPTSRGVALVAAGGAHDLLPGTRFESELDLAEAMIERHRQFGMGGPGVQERYAIAKANWKDDYVAADRVLRGTDEIANFDVIKPVIDTNAIKKQLRDRIHEIDKDLTLVASGGLCAPVTPYYNLQYISVPVRPVMGSLPSFNADRGGLRYARPAALSAVSTAVGLITEAEDHAGGSQATKTCQVIPCPPFQETDVDIIYHCLQFGNLGARVFPELVAQWNNLVLAAHARLAESNLLTQIDAFSTQVHAGSFGLGASASLFSQILAAANGLRSRNRMDPEAVLRLMIPWWAVDLIVSDVIRTQFQRFDTDRDRVTALLRSFNIEPTFYIDGANGRNQVFGTQGNTALLPFPPEVVWYLFPEGSFLYLDAGMLELGIVRDSVLNKTNDFQIFGETFENVAFVGVESLAVVSTVCDSGTVSLPHAVTCPIDYSIS